MFKASPESPRMFDSDFLDFFSRIHWSAVPIVFVPVIIGFLGYGYLSAGVSLPWLAVQFFAGFVTWTLWEYWLHRTTFHWIPDTSWGERFHFLVHGVHHDWPKDKLRLVMPPAVSATLCLLFFGMYWGLAQLLAPLVATTWVFAFMAGKVAGYVNYDVTHYYIHHGRPSLKFYKRLRAHHNNHHFNNHERKFGVSFTIWDHVFGTYE